MSTLRSELPKRLYRAEQVRELDRIAIEEHKLPGLVLMQTAGKVAFETLRSYWPQANKIVIACGAGNNAGDGYVVGKLAVEAGLDCRVIAVRSLEELSGDAKTAAQQYLSTGQATAGFSTDAFAAADVIVDAVFGTGLDRDVEGEYRELLSAINNARSPVLSVDIPSGIHADSGRCMGLAVKADVTVTFIGLKQGMFTAEGPEHSGSILFSDLDVPQQIYATQQSAATRLDSSAYGRFMVKRSRSSHKGHFGHVLVIGGDYGKAGAVRMAAEAAARVGAGLVTVATRPEHALSMSLSRPELMSCSIGEVRDLHAALDMASVVAIGPGLGQSQWAQSILSTVLETKLPLVLDADALNLLAQDPGCCEQWVLTPHPGEAARLLSTSIASIQADRYNMAKSVQDKYGGVSVLKGSGSIIADAEGLAVCCAGNPGMASGGMGDVLSGVIASLIAQGVGPGDAARAGVCLHAEAADAAAVDGERGMLAMDLMPFLRKLANP